MKWENQYEEELRQSSLFSALSEAQIKKVVDNAQVLTVESGGLLFSQGDMANHFYRVKSGLVKLYRLSPNGEEKIIEVVRPGQSFAEAIMFSSRVNHYPVNAEMIEGGEVWQFSSRDYKAVLEDSIETCFGLLANFSQRLHGLVAEIDRLTLQTASDRVINYLLQNQDAESGVVNLPVTKQTLASQLSIKPETLSRTFKKLTQDGLIEIDGAVIRLLDTEAMLARVQI